MTLAEIFANGIRAETGCLLWTRSRFPFGYGQVSFGGEIKRLHRLVWELAHGPVPPGLVVMHACDVPGCYEVSHLRVGTAADNSADMAAKGRHAARQRTACIRGHEFTPDNTHFRPSGFRVCRECSRARGRIASKRRNADPAWREKQKTPDAMASRRSIALAYYYRHREEISARRAARKERTNG